VEHRGIEPRSTDAIFLPNFFPTIKRYWMVASCIPKC